MLLYQSTHSQAADPTSSMVWQGLRAPIDSVVWAVSTDSAKAFSWLSHSHPTKTVIPISVSRSVYTTDAYRSPLFTFMDPSVGELIQEYDHVECPHGRA